MTRDDLRERIAEILDNHVIDVDALRRSGKSWREVDATEYSATTVADRILALLPVLNREPAMTRDELRKRIAKEVFEGWTGEPWPPEDDHMNAAAHRHADSILALMPGPVMPEEPSEAVIDAIRIVDHEDSPWETFYAIRAALAKEQGE